MRLNKLSDYAVLILIPLAQAWPEQRVVSARRLSDVATLPLPTVAKLLKLLGHQGLVISTRGNTGGYQLAKHPDFVSVADIIEAVEGPVALTECVTGSGTPCSVEDFCWMRGRWDPVNHAVATALKEVSLRDMMPQPFTFEPTFEERMAARPVDSTR